MTGADPLKPVTSFAHFGFDEKLMKAIRKSEYTQPTPIQAQVITILLKVNLKFRLLFNFNWKI